MIETLQFTTIGGVSVASVPLSSLTTDSATCYEEVDGKVTDSKLKPSGTIASLASSTITTGTTVYQNISEEKVLNDLPQRVEITETYLASLSDDELYALSNALEARIEPSESLSANDTHESIKLL